MHKRLVFGVVIIALILLTGIALFYCWPPDTVSKPLDNSQQGAYLSYAGKSSGIYLVNSSATFGTFDHFVFDVDGVWLGENGAVPGEPYLKITGTIRNDDTKILFVPLMANVSDRNGHPVGTIVRTNGHTEFIASYVGILPGETGDFLILVKFSRLYNLKDIASYEIYIPWEPMERPPT